MAATLFAVAFMGIIQTNINSRKESKTNEINEEINSIISASKKVLQEPDSCMQSFLGLGPIAEGLLIPEIKNHRGKSIFLTNLKYGNNLVIIKNISLSNLSYDPVKKTGLFNLKFTFEKQGKGFYGSKTVFKTIPIDYESDPANNLIKCNFSK